MLAQADLECKECHGPLCVVGQEVQCEQCGTPVKDHPLTKDKVVNPKPVTINFPHSDNPASIPERLLYLEKLVARMVSVVDRIEAQLKNRK